MSRLSLILALLLCLPLAAHADGDIDKSLAGLETFLRDERPQDIPSVFSPRYAGGLESLERRLKITWTQERLLRLRFLVEEYGNTDKGLAKVAVRWFKTYIDEDERNRRAGGHSVIHFDGTAGGLLIEALEGDRFF